MKNKGRLDLTTRVQMFKNTIYGRDILYVTLLRKDGAA